MRADLFTRDDISFLAWPETPDGSYARRYLLPFIVDGPQNYIRNVYNTSLMVARAGRLLLPVTTSGFHIENTYTCSPYSHYISYGGFEEVQRLRRPALEAVIKLALLPVAAYFRSSDFDRTALVNNWLLSTNLYPEMNSDELQALIDCLPEWFPDRAIVFRSVDAYRNPALFQILKERGYEMVFSRQVWYQYPPDAVRRRQFREDVRETRRNGHSIGEMVDPSDYDRVLELYRQLYLVKYSPFNPQFTADFLRLVREQGLLQLRTVQTGAGISGVMGYFVRNGVMTCPLFGYDTSLPQALGLYRMLSVAAMHEALGNGWLLHASAGVGKFKKLRGGQPVLEYNAVYTHHLPRRRQRPWKMIRAITDRAIPIIQKNEY